MARLVAQSMGLAASGLIVAGCGTSAHGVSACRSVEQARCRRAATACPTLGVQGDSALQACLEATRDRCLHGMPLSSDPPAATVNACVQAIEQASCDAVAAPDQLPACAVLFQLEADATPVTTTKDSVDAAADSGS